MTLSTVTLDTIDTLAMLLNEQSPHLLTALDQARSLDGYLRYEVPKGNGKVRVINAPAEPLKSIQRAILDRVLSRVSLSPFSHGFAPGKSIITNANVHAPTARAILSLDLLDAFPSVLEARVLKLIEWRVGPLIKLEAPELNSSHRREVYRALTLLCTRDGALPQGAPTSGYLLNLACTRLDRNIFGLALRSGIPQLRYSRYADDLTLTSSVAFSPDFQEEVIRTITRSGLSVNPSKIHTYTDAQKSIVICGVRLYQGRLALPRKALKRYRALFDHALSVSPDEIDLAHRQKIMGTLAFLRSIYPSCPTVLISPLNRLLSLHGVWLTPPTALEKGVSQGLSYSSFAQRK
jgi:RNA-directed DNA polymerase